MIPEFVGRLPILAPLMPLTVEAMINILTEPKNALVRQYQHMFNLERAKLRFTDAALRAIAEKALKRDTGARALRAVLEEIMIGLMYELPEGDHAGTEFVIDEGDVLKPKRLADIRVKRKESA
jgi:ATP-dependent Clp protease ATP-binding subunit ClpX